METAKLFMNGRSQAVRLPKGFRFEGEEVFVKKVGNAVVLLPRQRSWETLYESLGSLGASRKRSCAGSRTTELGRLASPRSPSPSSATVLRRA